MCAKRTPESQWPAPRSNGPEREGRIDVESLGTYTRMDAGFPQLGFAPDGGVERVRGVFHYVAGGVADHCFPSRNRNQGDAGRRARRPGGARPPASAALLVGGGRDRRGRRGIGARRPRSESIGPG